MPCHAERGEESRALPAGGHPAGVFAALSMTLQSIHRFFLPGLFSLAVAQTIARADQAADIARIHLEAIGGRERVDKLRGLRVTGFVVVGDKRVRFVMIAARPDRVRLETASDGRTL